MQRTRSGRLEESKGHFAPRPTGLRRVQEFDSLKMSHVRGHVLPQGTAHIAGALPTIGMSQRYPHLEGRDPQNRHAAIINGTLYGPYGLQVRDYRAQTFSHLQTRFSKKSSNRLTKAPPSHYVRGMNISEPKPINRLKSVQNQIIEEPITRYSYGVLQNTGKGLRRKEHILIPNAKITTAEDGTKTVKTSHPMAILTGPTSPVSRIPSMMDTKSSQEAGKARAYQIPSNVPLIPPRQTHTTTSTNIPVTANLSVKLTYKSLYLQQLEFAAKCQRELAPTEARLEAEREKVAALEEELATQRAQASLKRACSDHYKRLYERAKEDADRLLERLTQQHDKSDEEWRILKGNLDNEVASPLSPETPTHPKVSAELPCTPRDARRNGRTSWQQTPELLPSNPQRVLRHSNARPRIEAQWESEARVIHELPISSNYEISCPLAEQTVRETNEYQEPTFNFWDDLHSDTDSVSDSEDNVYELPTSQQLSSLLEELAEESAQHFCASGAESSDLYELDTSPSTPTPPSSTSAYQLLSCPSSSALESSPARAAEGIYRFGIPRIEVVPAVFRVPFVGSEIEIDSEDSEVADAAVKMDGWEWCSIPDLGLRDPRE